MDPRAFPRCGEPRGLRHGLRLERRGEAGRVGRQHRSDGVRSAEAIAGVGVLGEGVESYRVVSPRFVTGGIFRL